MSSPTSTFGLLERIQRGDREAFTPLYDRYSRRLAVLVHCRLGPELRESLEIEDVLQEVFLRAHRDLGDFQYRGPGSFMRWLASIAQHVIIDLARYHGREQRRAAETVRLRSDSNPGGPDPEDSRTPSRILRQKEEVGLLLAGLEALPEDYREAILLAKVEGLSMAEMAVRMGRSRDAVAVLLCRALQRIRAGRAS